MAGAFWVLGAIFATLGWLGDSSGFWENRSFLTNVFSSLTSACFGIPLALIILARVGAAQAEAFARRRVWHQFNVVSEDIKYTAELPVHHLFGAIVPLRASIDEIGQLSAIEREREINLAIEHLSRMSQSRQSLKDSWEFFYSEIRIRLLDAGYSYPRFPMMTLGERIRNLEVRGVSESWSPARMRAIGRREILGGMIEQYIAMDAEMKEIYRLARDLFDQIVSDNNDGAGPTRINYTMGGSGGL